LDLYIIFTVRSPVEVIWDASTFGRSELLLARKEELNKNPIGKNITDLVQNLKKM
jgi:hypothetical protein